MTSIASPVPAVGPRTAVASRRLRLMGGGGHLVVHAEPDVAAELAVVGESRLAELERRWSRFLPDSDVTRANRSAGIAVPVSSDTIAVVRRALDGWRQTMGRFDITVLPALVDAGYTHSALGGAVAPVLPGRAIGMSAWVAIDDERSTLTVPAGSAIDLGGIGKGCAADLVADELTAAGATGVLVNLGGDIAVRGTPSDDESWLLGIDEPGSAGRHVAILRVAHGGIATSGTTVRRWTTDAGLAAHHLIDPGTGRPSATSTLTATVLAADAATAEVFATAAMLLDAGSAVTMLDHVGLAGLVVDAGRAVHRTRTLGAFQR